MKSAFELQHWTQFIPYTRSKLFKKCPVWTKFHVKKFKRQNQRSGQCFNYKWKKIWQKPMTSRTTELCTWPWLWKTHETKTYVRIQPSLNDCFSVQCWNSTLKDFKNSKNHLKRVQLIGSKSHINKGKRHIVPSSIMS